MTNKTLVSLLSPGGWFSVNKRLLKQLGPDATVFLSYLIDLCDLHKTLEVYIKGGESVIQDYLGLSKVYLRNASSLLASKGLITKEARGVPQTLYYTINLEAIKKILEDTVSTDTENQNLDTSEFRIAENQNSESINSDTSEFRLTEFYNSESRNSRIPNRGKLSNNNSTITNNNISNDSVVDITDAKHLFNKYVAEAFIPVYPKKVGQDRVWNSVTKFYNDNPSLSVEEVTSVCRKINAHVPVYVKNTEHKYLLAPDNYIAARKWEEDISLYKPVVKLPAGTSEEQFRKNSDFRNRVRRENDEKRNLTKQI